MQCKITQFTTNINIKLQNRTKKNQINKGEEIAARKGSVERLLV